ncbi:hypothetical protein C0J50_17800, partial [Silurus asotus]
CSFNDTEYQCKCEDQYFWPCEKCTQYGSCDNDTSSSCGCINAFPNDGQFCQPDTELMNSSTCISPPANYLMEFEIDALDIIVLNQLRIELKNFNFPITISNVEFVELNITTVEYLVEVEIDAADIAVLNLLRSKLTTFINSIIDKNFHIMEINITTVCSFNDTEYQCKCEDQYFWPCEKCTQYGSCDNDTSSSCGCINAFPNDGHFCQPITELMIDYLVEVEIDAADIAVLNLLRSNLTTFNNSIIDNNFHIMEINITTVCSLNDTKYQCKCEDQYFWPCEKCTQYGSCNNDTSSLCGCINAFPNDGYFCQPTNELLSKKFNNYNTNSSIINIRKFNNYNTTRKFNNYNTNRKFNNYNTTRKFNNYNTNRKFNNYSTSRKFNNYNTNRKFNNYSTSRKFNNYNNNSSIINIRKFNNFNTTSKHHYTYSYSCFFYNYHNNNYNNNYNNYNNNNQTMYDFNLCSFLY